MSQDAVRIDPEASYAAAAATPLADDREVAVLSAQLGRPARGRPAVVHRCEYGLPTVARVQPRLDDGTPFPTVFWLTCPVLRSRVGRLEADHAMVGLNQRLEQEPGFAGEYAAGSERFVSFRDALGDPLPGDPSAGGMPNYIKCLHVHAAHHLATGDNPVGAWTVEHATPAPCPGPCVPAELLATERTGAGRTGAERTGAEVHPTEDPDPEEQMTTPRAAVDVGSNSVRLLVVDADGARLIREMAITRLAAGVDATGCLDDRALARTLETIARFRDVWVAFGVRDRVRIAATSAVRDAADRERFFAGVREVTGVDAEVITGEEEAGLAFAGAASAVEVARPTAVIDIGGGSTELIVGAADGMVAGSVSLQLGCVRVVERHLASDPPLAAELVAAQAMIDEQLDRAEEVLSGQGVALSDAASLIGVAGTATTLGAIHLGLDDYDEDRIHGTRLPAEALAAMAARLVSMTSAQRATLGPVQAGREDVIHGGALVLHAALARTGLGEVVISEADNLDGLVASLA